MDFDRHRAEIVTQTGLLVTGLAGADLRVPVPSCPGWTLGNLVRHVGGGQGWAEEVVRTRATGFLPDDAVRRLDGDDSAALPGSRLVEEATRLAATLGAAGPDARVWAPFHYRTAAFWARRFAHEVLVHRADAALAAGGPFDVAADVAADALDEWLELDALPAHFELDPDKRRVLGPGRTVALVATDADAAWFVDLTGEVITWRRGRGAAAVTVRAGLTDLLLTVYRRAAGGAPGIEADGDTGMLELYLARGAFG